MSASKPQSTFCKTLLKYKTLTLMSCHIFIYALSFKYVTIKLSFLIQWAPSFIFLSSALFIRFHFISFRTFSVHPAHSSHFLCLISSSCSIHPITCPYKFSFNCSVVFYTLMLFLTILFRILSLSVTSSIPWSVLCHLAIYCYSLYSMCPWVMQRMLRARGGECCFLTDKWHTLTS